ncbi:hypothetical protein HMPREF3224_01160 [Anaerococcus hydrogenalis]|nr:hypothetical protein HMPREF3224_01160 [Anaerococcus hydrogenalis]
MRSLRASFFILKYFLFRFFYKFANKLFLIFISKSLKFTGFYL